LIKFTFNLIRHNFNLCRKNDFNKILLIYILFLRKKEKPFAGIFIP